MLSREEDRVGWAVNDNQLIDPYISTTLSCFDANNAIAHPARRYLDVVDQAKKCNKQRGHPPSRKKEKTNLYQTKDEVLQGLVGWLQDDEEWKIR